MHFDHEIATGHRFEFGKNWNAFSKKIDDCRIQKAIFSVQKLLNGKQFSGKTFLDVGSGSGLMSLAARKLGMCVKSFDYDPTSVACTIKLKEQYFKNDPQWLVYQGSVLDKSFLSCLGKFDYVYAWGVLHHTGDMWGALDNVINTFIRNTSVYFDLLNIFIF